MNVIVDQDLRDDGELADARAELRQRRKDWDALVTLIAVTLGDEDERKGAEMGEIEEFDPWSALRAHRSQALTAEEREALAWLMRWDSIEGHEPQSETGRVHHVRALAVLARLAGETP